MVVEGNQGDWGLDVSIVLDVELQAEVDEREGGRSGMAILDPEIQYSGQDRIPSLEPEWPADLPGVVASPVEPPRVRRRLLGCQLIADVIGLSMAVFAGPAVIAVFSAHEGDRHQHVGQVLLVGLAAIPLFIGVFALHGLYRGVSQRISMSVFPDLRNIAHALAIAGFVFVIILYFAQEGGQLRSMSVAKVVSVCLAAAVLVPLARALAFGPFASPEVRTVPIIVVGTGKLAATVASHLRAQSGVNFVGFVDDHPLESRDVIGKLRDLPALCQEHGVARVVVCFSRTHPEHTTEMLRGLAGTVGVSIIPRYYELITNNSRVEDLSGLTMLDITPSALSLPARFVKRFFDLMVSSLILLVTSPIFLGMAVAIKVSSRGPVFFRQARTGRHEQPFAVLKFRSMYEDAESQRSELSGLNEVDGPLFKVINDPRVTPVGRFMRRKSLDELAQLVNVWKGDMSLVGPRPFVVAESQAIEGWARKRFEVRPGMTGLWQVSGRNELSHLELCRLDYQYVASWTFWWDMQILWNTPRAVLKGRGAS